MGSTIYTPTITTLKEENDEQKSEIDYKPSLKERREQQKTKGKKRFQNNLKLIFVFLWASC